MFSSKYCLKLCTENPIKNYFNLIILQKNAIFNNTTHLRSASSVNYAKNFNRNHLTPKPIDENTLKTDNVTEKEFLVRLKNDPDQFGGPSTHEFIDEGDILEEKRFTEQTERSKKLRTKQYADLIKDLIKKRKIKEALDVLEVRMLKEDKVKPENYIYNLLLGACGKVGYTKKAFSLYNQMKKRGLKIMGGTYTALFNACANSPWPETDGLTRASHLRDIMIEKGYEPNDTNYNAMIKAFGRCGDLQMAFRLVDEMTEKRFQIKDDTMNFLLQACITDKNAGFRHALLVWHKMYEKSIQPSVYSYNLMLKCVRDCGLGDIDTTKDVIDRLLQDNIKIEEVTATSGVKARLESSEFNKNDQKTENSDLIQDTLDHKLVTIENQLHEASKESIAIINQVSSFRPNLLAKTPTLGGIMSLSEVTKPEDRLLLIGGCSGFLQNMTSSNCTPDIKTFSQLLEAIPNTNAAEKELLIAMKKANVKPDIDFYNMLIKKKSMRFDYDSAKEVLISMKQMKYRPDLVTYGVLALGCKNKEEALELIQEMKEASYSLNAEILGAMLYQACYHMNFGYALEIMQLCIRENVQPNKKFIEHLDRFKKKCWQKQNAKELSHNSVKAFGIFKARYKTWLQEVTLDESEGTHPWEQYRKPTEGDVKYQWKNDAGFKPRRQSLFRVKTSTKQKKYK